MTDGEWYIFVANPDYEECNASIGEACGGVTIAHLNLDGSASRNLPGVPASGVAILLSKSANMKLLGRPHAAVGYTYMI